jgi:hypothetical protein
VKVTFLIYFTVEFIFAISDLDVVVKTVETAVVFIAVVRLLIRVVVF